MGGNAYFNGHYADPILIFDQPRRELFQDRIARLMACVSGGVCYESGRHLWNLTEYPIENFFAGSTEHLFNPKISTAELISVKKTFGDIDVQVAKERLSDLILFLVKTRQVEEFYLVGWENSIDTVITLWEDPVTQMYYQVDFEIVDFVGDLPSPWAKFSRSSSWEDLRLGIKGFAHKYIFRAITAIWLIDADVRLKTKTVKRKISPVVFSPKGARQKYREISEGLWAEIPMVESKLCTNVFDLFTMFFGSEPTAREQEKMHSFCGVVEIILDHIEPVHFKAICDGMFNLLWGKGSQELYRDAPDLDYRMKCFAYSYMADKLGENPDVYGLTREYYKSY